MSLQLLVIAGPDQGRTFTLQAGPDLMLGRSQHSYYRLTDPRVSRNHCQLLLQGGQATVIDGGTLIEQVTRIRQTEPVKPTRCQMSIPPPFESAVLKLLAKRPEDRYQTAAALVKDLERVGKIHGVTV
jgi:hypothetical protein